MPRRTQGAPKSVAVSAHLRRIAEEIVSSVPVPIVELDFDGCANLFVGEETARAIGVIVGEWVSNAVEYAHPAGVPGRIMLGSSRCPDGSIEIQICDDGVGLPEGFDPTSQGHKGFQLVQKVAGQMGAVLRSRSNELGLCMTLSVPAALAV